MSIIVNYYREIQKILDTIISEENEKIEAAASLICDTVINDRLFYVFGTGAHSIMSAMEVFMRAGNLCNAQGIFPGGLADFDGHPKIESVLGMSKAIFDYYDIKKGDILLICNVNGINHLTIETAEEAKKRGIKTIAITSVDFSNSVDKNIPQRHPSNKNLYEITDLYIDAHVPVGDALMEIKELDVKCGPGSTYPMIFIVNSIMLRAIEMAARKGKKPPVMKSANVAGGNEYNQKYYEKYKTRIRHFG